MDGTHSPPPTGNEGQNATINVTTVVAASDSLIADAIDDQTTPRQNQRFNTAPELPDALAITATTEDDSETETTRDGKATSGADTKTAAAHIATVAPGTSPTINLPLDRNQTNASAQTATAPANAAVVSNASTVAQENDEATDDADLADLAAALADDPPETPTNQATDTGNETSDTTADTSSTLFTTPSLLAALSTDQETPTTTTSTPINTTPVVNAVPAITVANTPLLYTENDGAQIISSDLTLLDTDNTVLQQATVRITSGFATDQDRLSFQDQNGITGHWDASGLLTLSGQATVAQYQSALRSVTYENTSEAPDATPRTIRFAATDGTGSGQPATATVTVTPVNDLPQLTADTSAAALPGGIVVNNSGLLANDHDLDGTLTTVTVNGQAIAATGTTMVAGTFGTLHINSAGQWNYAPDALTTAAAQANYSHLDALTDAFSYTVSDGITTASTTLTVAVNRTPQALASSTATLTEDTATFTGQLLALDRDSNDSLTYRLLSGPDNGFVTVNTDGSYSYSPGHHFQSLQAGETGHAAFTYQVTDAHGASDTGTVQITVNGLHEAGPNIVTNPSAETGNLSGWHVIANGGDGWGVTSAGQDGNNGFITSYAWASKAQLIDLTALGYSAATLDNAPAVSVSEWYQGFFNTNDAYYFKVQLLDGAQNVISTFDTGVLTTGSNWQQVSHVFTNYGTGLRSIYVEHGGKDIEFWAGHYGAMIDNTQVTLDVPPTLSNNGNTIALQASQLTIHDSQIASLSLNGSIVTDNGFSSVDQWTLNHHGGALTVDLTTPDSPSWAAGLRLYSQTHSSALGPEIITNENATAPASDTTNDLTINDLPAGQYLLAVGHPGLTEQQATSNLDYPNPVSGEQAYQLQIQGNTALASLPRDPEDHAHIVAQTHTAPAATIQFELALTADEPNSQPPYHYHYDMLHDNTRLGQGQISYLSGQNLQTIAVTVSHDVFATLSLEKITLALYEVDTSSGMLIDRQTFAFSTASTAGNAPLVPANAADGLQAVELINASADEFDLIFELLDEQQDPLYA